MKNTSQITSGAIQVFGGAAVLCIPTTMEAAAVESGAPQRMSRTTLGKSGCYTSTASVQLAGKDVVDTMPDGPANMEEAG